MMILPTKEERKLYEIWRPYVEEIKFKKDSFADYIFKKDAPKDALDAFQKYKRLVLSRPKYPSFD